MFLIVPLQHIRTCVHTSIALILNSALQCKSRGLVLGEMGEERVRKTRDHKFDLIMPLFLIFFNPQFIYSAFALVNYYHINSD